MYTYIYIYKYTYTRVRVIYTYIYTDKLTTTRKERQRPKTFLAAQEVRNAVARLSTQTNRAR